MGHASHSIQMDHRRLTIFSTWAHCDHWLMSLSVVLQRAGTAQQFVTIKGPNGSLQLGVPTRR